MNYYNEWDAYAAQWLRNLIAEGLIPAGDVDTRSITEVQADDVRGYTQVHFFAGIGGWPLALGLAGWPTDRPVWTGSCPCQPFSAAGKGLGEGDPRHLWPQMRRLVAECHPAVVAGEQVASKAGRAWLAGVRADLEALDYAVGAADLCAASIEAPHIRQRLFWVADAGRGSHERGREPGAASRTIEGAGEEAWQREWGGPHAGRDCRDGGVAHGEEHRRREGRSVASRRHEGVGAEGAGFGPTDDRGGCGLPDAPGERRGEARSDRQPPSERAPWAGAEWIPCLDGKARRIESGLEPLAHGVPNRVGRLRAYGNAIVPQLAATFIEGYLDAATPRRSVIERLI